MQNKKKNNKNYYNKKISQGVILTIITFVALFSYKKDVLFAKVFLYETIPYLNIENDMTMLFKFKTYENEIEKPDTVETFVNVIEQEVASTEKNNELENVVVENNIEENILEEETTELIGINNVIFQDEDTGDSFTETVKEDIITKEDLEKLKDIEYLKNKFYIVSTSGVTKQQQTAITKADFDVNKFVNTDLKIDNAISGPKVLIIHTHIHEMFVDSDPNNLSTGIRGVGEHLKKELEEKYNIEVMHHVGEYDFVDGKNYRDGSYERMEIPVTKILKDNPSIQVVIDLHRDGIPETKNKSTTNINEKQTALIMFFNGLSKIMKNGTLESISGLENKNLPTNLAFSFDMQLIANSLYPSFTRKIYLSPYRYSLHMLPKSTLIEVGSQKNTMEEAFNTAKPLAEVIAKTILK